MRVTLVGTTILAATAQTVSALTWGKTQYLMVFGDSYTTTGYNISAGINSPTPGWVTLQSHSITLSHNLPDI